MWNVNLAITLALRDPRSVLTQPLQGTSNFSQIESVPLSFKSEKKRWVDVESNKTVLYPIALSIECIE